MISGSNPKPPPRRKKPNVDLSSATPNNTPNLSSADFYRGGTRPAATRNDVDDEDDDFRPVDVDLNAVKNLLESYESQHGVPGPTSSILGGMGMHLPASSGKR